MPHLCSWHGSRILTTTQLCVRLPAHGLYGWHLCLEYNTCKVIPSLFRGLYVPDLLSFGVCLILIAAYYNMLFQYVSAQQQQLIDECSPACWCIGGGVVMQRHVHLETVPSFQQARHKLILQTLHQPRRIPV